MTVLSMSKQEFNRLDVLLRVQSGRLRITDAVRPGVISSEKGAWLRTSPNGQTVSALAPTHKADLAEGACYNDCRVEVAVH